jgi:MFS family permease
VTQFLYLSFAPVTTHAMKFYNANVTQILLLSVIFMIVYIPFSLFASWFINKYGFKLGASIGAILIGLFGFLRFFAGNNYIFLLTFQTGIAVGYPFILNAISKLSANWFPKYERTTATAISMMAIYIGKAIGLLITPFIVKSFNFEGMLLIYGIISLISGGFFVIFAKNKPLFSQSNQRVEEKVFMGKGLKNFFTNPNFLIVLLISAVGIGVLNMITSYIELIVIPRGYDSIFAGFLGMLIIMGGSIGTILMSFLSDKLNMRKLLIIISLVITTVCLLFFSFTSNGVLLLISGFFFGFGLMGITPVALEYAVDATKPVPESMSNGIIFMVGQFGSIILIFLLQDFKTPSGDYFPALILEAVLFAICLFASIFMAEFKSQE